MNATANTTPATDAELLAAIAVSPNFVTVEGGDHLAHLLDMDQDEIPADGEVPVTTEALSDIICRVMAWWITSGLDDGDSLITATMTIPVTEYRRERVTTWIREMGRPAAIAALYAYAKSPSQIAAEAH
jgi:hypothetical protein